MTLLRTFQITGAAAIAAAALGLSTARPAVVQSAAWTAEEREMMKSLSLASLGGVPTDPSNKYADSPAAAKLGAKLFFDERLSGNGKVSCATCHLPTRDFQDGIPLGKGVGTAGRRTMPLAGSAHSPWQFWDGRSDSQWAQALGPLESPVEHGGNRKQYAATISRHHTNEYKAVFGMAPDSVGDVSRVYSNIGKAIAAFERKIEFTPARFDKFVAVEIAGGAHTADNDLTQDERAGLRLFMGKANCANCHNGARFTDDHFHNTGVAQSADGAASDSGRTTGVRAVVTAEFNCLSKYSDAKAEECSELQFAVTEGDELVRAFKTPSLRNVVGRGPFMHAGQIATLPAVLDHYNRAPRAPAGKSELRKLRLSAAELKQLEAFLGTLTSPVAFPTYGHTIR